MTNTNTNKCTQTFQTLISKTDETLLEISKTPKSMYMYIFKPVDRGGSVGSDEPPRLPNGPLEVFRKLLYWLLLTLQIAVTCVEGCSNMASFLVACTVRGREQVKRPHE